jgi:hypothetical protein
MINYSNTMKRLISIVALCVAVSATSWAQSGLGDLLGGKAGNTIGNVLSSIAGTVYTQPVTLDGNYNYNGVAVSATSTEGGILTNLAGSAVTSGIETKADEYLAKIGVKPGALSWTFNKADGSFTLNLGSLSLPGSYKVGDGERTVSLTFGKSMQFLNMTGTLESSSGGARMLFTADKAMAFIKKLASVAGQSSSQVSSISRLADGYDHYRIGFKLTK